MDDQSQLPYKSYFPNISVNTYFWLVLLVTICIAGLGGFLVGFRASQSPTGSYITTNASSSSTSQQILSPTLMPGDDGDIDYTSINGTFTTDDPYYDQFYVYIDQFKNGVTTGQRFDDRLVTDPQQGIIYPYAFSLLDPTQTYALRASACHINPQGLALDCAKNIRITKCTGTVLSSSTCVIGAVSSSQTSSTISVQGEVDFSVRKSDNYSQPTGMIKISKP